MRYKVVLFLFIVGVTFSANAQVRVGLFHGKVVQSLSFQTSEKVIIRYSNRTLHFDELENEVLFAHSEKQIQVLLGKDILFYSKKISIEWNGIARLFVQHKGGRMDSIAISGGLELLMFQNTLKLVLITDETSYLEGVVAAEIGKFKPHETNKSQAVIARTYYYAQKTKHRVDGFDCCDGTHCQAFRGFPFDENAIKSAVNETKGIILVHDNFPVVDALYHANCGGNTCSTELIWASSLPYLVPVTDTFCLDSPGAVWERVFDQDFFLRKLNLPTDNVRIDETFLCTPPHSRTKKYQINTKQFSGVDIRNTFDLKSAWFYLDYFDNKVIVKGRGYGHGAGLCQEGAIRMGQYGYTMHEILNFYYPLLRLNKQVADHFETP